MGIVAVALTYLFHEGGCRRTGIQHGVPGEKAAQNDVAILLQRTTDLRRVEVVPIGKPIMASGSPHRCGTAMSGSIETL